MTSPETESPTPEGVSRIGTVISGRYRIRELLGEGGMGAVYLAEHTHMKKRVALKLLHAEMSDNVEVQSRFEREAMAAAHIEHPNVAAATDFGKTEDGAYFLVLEYIEGTSLRDALGPGPLSVARSLRIARQIALALERAHEAGIVHRDLKPENVMLVRRENEPDFVKVLDFGIAKVLELGASASADAANRNNSGQALTRMGTILGTPEYMAPEQALGEPVTPAADLYGVGVILYEMLTGLHPFDPPDRVTMLTFHIVAPVPPMLERNPNIDVPAMVEAVARCLLEKDAKKRYANARALIEAIDTAAATSGIELTTPSGRESGPRSGPSLSRDLPSQQKPTTSEPRGAGWGAGDAFAKTSLGEPAVNAITAASPEGNKPLSSARTFAVAGLTRAREKLRQQPRNVLLALAAALPLAFILLVVLVVLAFRTPKPAADGEPAPSSSGRSIFTFKDKTAPEGRVKAAIALGPEALEALVKEFPEDTSLLGKLAIAYQAQGRATEAMKTVRTLLAAEPKSASDDAVVDLVTLTAVKGKGGDDDEAFALLEGPLGASGVDALLELTTKSTGRESRELRELRARAARSLAKPEVRSHASPAAAVLLEMKSAQSCTAKHDLLDRAKDDGDARMLATLKSLKSGRGCGFLGRGDCWPCLRRDSALEDAVTAIEARPAPK